MTDYLVENGIKSVLFWIVGFFALWLTSLLFLPHAPQAHLSAEQNKWQAVFLTNNQVYFGKLTDENDEYLSLAQVYYLRSASDLDQTQSTTLNLIKLGGEVHGPEDVIHIPKKSVLFFENMKDTSRVVQTINSTKQ